MARYEVNNSQGCHIAYFGAMCAHFNTFVASFFFPPVEMMSTAFLVLTEKATSRPLLCISQNRGTAPRLSSQHGTIYARAVIADRQHTFCLVILLFSGISKHVSCNRTTDIIYLEDQRDAVLSSLYLFYCQVSLHVSGVSRTHHQEYTNCSYNHWYKS